MTNYGLYNLINFKMLFKKKKINNIIIKIV